MEVRNEGESREARVTLMALSFYRSLAKTLPFWHFKESDFQKLSHL